MERTFAKKSNTAFKHIIFLFIAISGMATYIFFEIYQKVYVYATAMIHNIQAACSCTQWVELTTMHPLLFGVFIVLSSITLLFLVYAAYRFISLIVRTRKFVKHYLVNVRHKHSSKLHRIIFDLHLKSSKIIEIRDSHPAVFCFGLFNPKICISSGLIKILHADELEAVLLHEYHHMISREPLKLFVTKFFHSIFFFLPGITTSIKKYITFSELAADERATNNFADRFQLARALFKISQKEDRQVARAGLALSFFSTVITERVNTLSDIEYIPAFKFWGRSFFGGVSLVVLTVLFLFGFMVDSSKAFEMHAISSCTSKHATNSSKVLSCNSNDEALACLEQTSHFGQLTDNCIHGLSSVDK